MNTARRRIEKLKTALSPKQAILLWLQEAHSFNTVEEYVRHLKDQRDIAWPIDRLTTQVEEAVKQDRKGQPNEKINRAIRSAYRDVLFLFYLHQRVNSKLISESRYYWTQCLLLIRELKSLINEQELDREQRWERIQAEMRMPYPLDSETAAAVEAAKQNHVLDLGNV